MATDPVTSNLDRVARIVSRVERNLEPLDGNVPELHGAIYDTLTAIMQVESIAGYAAVANSSDRLQSLWLRAVSVRLISRTEYEALAARATAAVDSGE